MKSIKIEVKDFNTEHIFDCGQCFRWRRLEDGSYTGVAKDRIVNMKEEKGVLTITPIVAAGSTDPSSEKSKASSEKSKSSAASEKVLWWDYLDLDRDYGKIKRTLKKGDPAMAEAIKAGEGIRILKQDLWETIVSFIISQNNHIPRIKGCIETLSESFGEPVSGLTKREARKLDLPDGLKAFNIPSPKTLAKLTPEDLAPVRLGYRDKYLIETAKQVLESGLPESFDELSKLTGVGPKVANCIALFGLGKMDSFPIDVWVKRVMARVYGFDESKDGEIQRMAHFAKDRFGDLGGFAQQYLFYYIRSIS